MSAGSSSTMSGIGEADGHDAKLTNAISPLEKDVQNYTLNAKQIAADCADGLNHLDEMSKMYQHE